LYFIAQKLKIISGYGSGREAVRGRGTMDELTGWLAAKAGIDDAVAEKTIGIILGFLRREGPADKVQALIDKIPGAEAAISASENNGGMARLMGGGLMAVGTRLMGLGLGISDIQNIARELFRFGKEKIGEDQMGAIIAGTPGLTQFA
jgi:phosphoglycerate dehydrogenase-like enzyme